MSNWGFLNEISTLMGGEWVVKSQNFHLHQAHPHIFFFKEPHRGIQPVSGVMTMTEVFHLAPLQTDFFACLSPLEILLEIVK